MQHLAAEIIQRAWRAHSSGTMGSGAAAHEASVKQVGGGVKFQAFRRKGKSAPGSKMNEKAAAETKHKSNTFVQQPAAAAAGSKSKA